MRAATAGVRSYRTAPGRWAVLALSGAAAAAAGAAHAENVSDVSTAAEVSRVVVTGQRTPLDLDTALATFPATIQDTPQAITVISSAQLEAQGVSSLEGALRNVPGITIAIGEGGTLSGDQFKIRGFDAKDDVYLDGLRDFGVYTRDSFNDQEVQVLKGPSGALFGRGSTGGAINTVSKAPRLDDAADVDLYAGSARYVRALADVQHRLGETSALRLNLMAHSAGVADRDLVYSRRWGAALGLGLGLGTDTTLTATLLHQHNHQRPDYGIVIVQRPGETAALPATEYDVGVERSSFLGFRNDIDRSDTDMLTVRLSHKAGEHLTFTSDARYAVYSRYFQYTTLDQCREACTAALFDGDPATEAFGGIGGSSPYKMDAWGLQDISTARLDADLGRFRNHAILGLDVSKQVNDKRFLAYSLPPGVATRPAMPHPIVDPDPAFPPGYAVFNPVPGVNLFCPATGACSTTVGGATVFSNVTGTGALRTRGESTDIGLFLTDRLWLSDAWSVIGSYRLDAYRATLDSVLYTGEAAPTVKARSTLKSPRASLVFEPAPDWTFYLSWGRSQTPQGTSIVGAGTALSVSAKDLAPETGEIWEAGAKLRIPGTRLAATASVFDIKKDNALQVDPATGFLQAESGEKQEVRGLELGLSGKITPQWSVSAGYAFLDAKIRDSFTSCAVATDTVGAPDNVVCPPGAPSRTPVLNTVAVGRQVAFVPRHSASLFTSYDLGRWVEGLEVGGDVVYQSRLFLRYTARSISFADPAALTPAMIAQAPESLTFDAYAAWRVGRWRFAVNAYNLGDRLNYAQVFGNRATPAPGRTVILSAGLRF
jgi:catecholate siderophore receptor